REYLENLRTELGNQVISGLMDPLMAEYVQQAEIYEYLGQVKQDVLDNLLDFVEDDDKDDQDGIESFSDRERDRFSKYRINLFVDNSQQKTAPVIIETNP